MVRDLCIFHGSDNLTCGDFSANGAVCVTGGLGRVATIWDCDGGECIMKMPGHQSPISALSFKVFFSIFFVFMF